MTESADPTPNDDGENNTGLDKFVPVTGAKLSLLIFSLSLSCFLILLDTSIVSTAIPKITDDFHSLSDVGWYGSAYLLGSRAIAGAGASGLMNGALVMLAASVPLQKRPPLTGVIMGVGQFGVVLGPLIGGAFTTGYTWRWCFYINLPLGLIVAIPLILLHVPEQTAKDRPLTALRTIHRRLDLLGFVLFAPAIIQLLLALQFGGSRYPWKSSQVIGLFCGATATLAVWGIWNAYWGPGALLNFTVIRRRRVWISGVCYTALTITVFGSSYFLPIYFQAVKGVSAVMSGVYMLAGILPQVVASVSGGILVPKVGYIPPFVLIAGVFLAVSGGLFSLFQPGTPTSQWVGYQILAGVGRGIGFQMPLIAVQHSVSPAELSDGMTFVIFCQYIGPAISLTAFNTILDSRLQVELHRLVPDINPGLVLKNGATGFRKVVSTQDLPGVLKAYSNSLDIIFYVIAGAGCIVFFSGFGMGWNNLGDTAKKPVAALISSARSALGDDEKSAEYTGSGV
ncbi:major facilitator superfamily transporter multidrug resistance [Grosmannia clavigera kw1407]|uniref:Major facilitator superfamily transporter multidrug resistance n=1 Tax=Grosmannia clavigera (strain kw1407 / UAMH 11150) TaxID=655863 RepID=F0XQV6_GROCL|nr:major facilitator superfamily transporter multidrug resistance [Grosmannia clavigera kw1407]EFW99912.1 major facilitator superfamily transporter multidrug resistance [Grosmannia clavigera kw1407]